MTGGGTEFVPSCNANSRLRRKVRAEQPCRGYTAPASATPAIARCSPPPRFVARVAASYGTQSPLSLLAPVDAGASRTIFAPEVFMCLLSIGEPLIRRK